MQKRLFLCLLMALVLIFSVALSESQTEPSPSAIDTADAKSSETSGETSAFEEGYPKYGACTGERVNVRKQPDEMYPSKGQLIRHSPVVVLSEKGDTYYCSTYFGEGYVPKKYIELFPEMTSEEFKEYQAQHPSVYRKKLSKWEKENGELYAMYYNGELSREDLLELWNREPDTGYTGLRENDNGKLAPFRWDWY
ncbi:MAG: SH3 domain-containing protein [Clostridia bacterium]|nr:SH3 domain-containing protein [Clostridia bacterium]